jgi:hypothetical protein
MEYYSMSIGIYELVFECECSNSPDRRWGSSPGERGTSRLSPVLPLQFRVLRLGLFQDGNVRVGLLPEREEILVRHAGLSGVAL